MDPIVISSYSRTPIGKFLGALSKIPAPELGALAIKDALNKTLINLDNIDLIDTVYMGSVLTAGQGQAPARQAALKANLKESTTCTTINKMCGSGMQAVILGDRALKLDEAKIVVAGGMENMSLAPYLIPGARSGLRFGHKIILDHMLFDGLEDAYNPGKSMGYFAELTSENYHLSRAKQDLYATQSVLRAQKALKEGIFKNELTPMELTNDEGPMGLDVAKIAKLKSSFKEDGTITAANSSSISDGAAAFVLTKLSTAEKLGLNVVAKILGHAEYAHKPELFTTAPSFAINKLLSKLKMKIKDFDLFEINEAFAVVTMIAMQELKLDHEIVNVHGGACVLGHPIGASGARIIATLLNALKVKNLKRGIATLCIGGGEATAIAVELL